MQASEHLVPAERSEILTAVTQLGRTSLLGVTFIFVLLGAASADSALSADTLVRILAAAIAYHVAVYAWNDVFDLEVDRQQPRRATSPLVRGVISARDVALGASVAALLALALAALGGASEAAWMVAALVLLLVYDAYGKRLSVSPLTDLTQGVGWAALVAYGAAAANRPTATTWWVAAYVIGAILLTNGVHGGIRDLRDDARAGARTTALLLGAAPIAGGGARLTRRLVVYAHGVQLAMLSALFGGLAQTSVSPSALLFAAIAGAAACIGLLAHGLSVAATPARSWLAAFVHLLVLLTLPLLLVADRLDATLIVLFALLFGLPWATVRGPWQRGRAAARASN